jgi:hypothetical protein
MPASAPRRDRQSLTAPHGNAGAFIGHLPSAARRPDRRLQYPIAGGWIRQGALAIAGCQLDRGWHGLRAPADFGDVIWPARTRLPLPCLRGRRRRDGRDAGGAARIAAFDPDQRLLRVLPPERAAPPPAGYPLTTGGGWQGPAPTRRCASAALMDRTGYDLTEAASSTDFGCHGLDRPP